MNRTTKRIAPLGLLFAFATWCCWQSLETAEPFNLLDDNILPAGIKRAQLEPVIGEEHVRDPFTIVVAEKKPEPIDEGPTFLTSITSDPIIDLTEMLSTLELHATYIHGDRRLAMINSQTFFEGQTFDSLAQLDERGTIAQILHDAVFMDFAGQRYRLSYQGVSLVPFHEAATKPISNTGPFFLGPLLRMFRGRTDSDLDALN